LTPARSYAGSKFGLPAQFARDLAARVQRVVSGRSMRATPARAVVARGAGRPLRASPAVVSLAGVANRVLDMKLANPMEAIEIALLSRAILDTEGNITAAAELLGIHRKAVERLLVKHKLNRGGSRRGRRAGAR
jgi:DNA-binding NtrC family response regulator